MSASRSGCTGSARTRSSGRSYPETPGDPAFAPGAGAPRRADPARPRHPLGARARLSGATATTALLAFAGGAFATVFTIFNDPRARFLRRDDPVDAPPDAQVAARLRQALQATLPSTVGVSVLAAIAVIPYPALAAFLGGISAGLGVAGALSATRTDPALYVDVRRGIVYRKPH